MQRQTFPGVFVHERQPLERFPVHRAVRDKVVRPDVVLALGRLARATVGTRPWLRPRFLGSFQADRPPQSQLVPEPADPFEIHRPALLAQASMDPPITETGMSPCQPPDGTDNGVLTGPGPWAVAERRAGSPQKAARPPLRNRKVLDQVSCCRSLLVGRHHFF